MGEAKKIYGFVSGAPAGWEFFFDVTRPQREIFFFLFILSIFFCLSHSKISYQFKKQRNGTGDVIWSTYFLHIFPKNVAAVEIFFRHPVRRKQSYILFFGLISINLNNFIVTQNSMERSIVLPKCKCYKSVPSWLRTT